MSAPTTSPAARDASIDVARGLAVLLMIQTHGYDGWASTGARMTTAFRVTRELGAIPAPIFLLLAGFGLGMADGSSEKKGADAAATRRALALRGLQVAATGYAVSLAYACIDWSFASETLLRADILQAIGLSLAACAVLVVRRPRSPVIAACVAALALAAPLLLPRLDDVSAWPIAARAALAPFVDVPGYTRFPVLPLVAFVALGHALGRAYRPHVVSSGAAIGLVLGLGVAAAGLEWATHAAVTAYAHGPLTHAHPAVVLNFLDGAARALAVVALSVSVTPSLPSGVRAALSRLGRASLFAYAIHIPLCYGRLASPVARKLGMGEATVAYVTLCVLVWLAVWARDSIAARRARVTS